MNIQKQNIMNGFEFKQETNCLMWELITVTMLQKLYTSMLFYFELKSYYMIVLRIRRCC